MVKKECRHQGKSNWGIVLLGLSSFFWLLFRSGRKPSRLRYPCQQLALTNSLAFFSWFTALATGRWLLPRLSLAKRVLLVSFSLGLFVSGLKSYRLWQQRRLSRVIWGQASPSRVVWLTDPRAAQGWRNRSWEEKVDQQVANQMVAEALLALTGQNSVAQAWTWLFQHHNADGHDYRPGEKIAIKINFNNRHNYEENYNPTIQIIRALLRTLIDLKGVRQEDVIVYDTSRPFVDYQIERIRRFYPNVILNPDHPNGPDSYGCLGSSASVLGAALGKTLEEATYLINMPLLRTHSAAGITLSFKNHLGSTCQPRNFHGAFFNTTPETNSLVQLNRHPYIREKTILILADAIYGLRAGGPSGDPDGSNGIKPYPNSIFVSQDPVAIDSVMADYLESLDARMTPSGNDPRTYLRVAAAAGLGNHSTSCQNGQCRFEYPNIELIRCQSTCSAGPTPTASLSPTPTPSPQPTATPTPSPSPSPTATTSPFCLSCPSSQPAHHQGNANCDDQIDLIDFALWLDVYQRQLEGEVVESTEAAVVDFNCQPDDQEHQVDLVDFSIWQQSYQAQLE